jgi:hypothetical protein
MQAQGRLFRAAALPPVGRNAMRFAYSLVRGFLLGTCAALARAAAPDTLIVNDAGDAGNGTCTPTCTLRDAIAIVASGGTVMFDPAILPGVIVLQQGALIAAFKSFNIEGPGAALLEIDGNLAGRIFIIGVMSQPQSVTISGLSLANGRAVGAGGGSGASGTGSAGGTGAPAAGGCIDLEGGSLTLIGVTLRNCTAQGGNGGDGGSGTAGGSKTGGAGGSGGDGGAAGGAAIYARVSNDLVLSQTSIVGAHAIGGGGGKGGRGGDGLFLGNGGDGGYGAYAAGGAILLNLPHSFHATNVTIAQSGAQGGNGGNGGSGDPDIALGSGGDGGDGGYAHGGLFFANNTGPLPSFSIYFGFTTLAAGVVSPGTGGSGGRGTIVGSSGNDGAGAGAALQIFAAPFVAAVDHTAIFGTSPLCGEPISALQSYASDPTCMTDAIAGLGDWFEPLNLASATPSHAPRFGRPAIDTGDCLIRTTPGFPDPQVVVDMQGTARPQGVACDLGAIEADYVFVGDFD